MKLFLVKFREISQDKEVYDELYKLSKGRTFLPLDKHTFVFATDKTRKTVKGTLAFDVESNVLLIDISDNHPQDFFIDNDFDNSHLSSFIEEFRNERRKYNSNFDENVSELDILLDKVSKHGMDELTGYEQERLRELSN